MSVLYRLTKAGGAPVGVFDTLEEAQRLVPEVSLWKQSDVYTWLGWCPENVLRGTADFKIESVRSTG